ncbi:MAG: glutamate--tRNA ligase, partial [Deltaproteobacteria bacterium]|nr:glutamate--tRNA ligase [Deltaproteobacteria bacterium]
PDFLNHAVDDLRSRSKTLVEMADSGQFYFADEVTYDPEAAKKFLTPEIVEHLQAIMRELPQCADYSKTGIEQFLRRFTEERGVKLKIIAQPLRVALTGKTVSPGIDDVMITLGKERVVRRLEKAVAFITSGGKT